MKELAPFVETDASTVRSILVVDDEADVRNMIVRVLEMFGFPCVACTDGETAVRTFAERGHEFAAVICDVAMPGMDGFSTLAALRRADPTVPALLISGHLHSTPTHLPPGVTFLAKPFTLKELRARLESMIRGRGAIRGDPASTIGLRVPSI